MSQNSGLSQIKIWQKLINVSGIVVIFCLGCAVSLLLLYISMWSYGDSTASIQMIKDSAIYWLSPVAVFTFIGLIGIAESKRRS